MTKNDRSLLTQMIERGKFNWEIYELLVEQNAKNSKALIKKMGNKWVCHPDNFVKKLDVPLPILSQSKVLGRR